MMTIISIVTIKQGSEPPWDAAMSERLAAASTRPGWIAAQLVIPIDRLDQRGIIGSWETRAHWEAWHNDPAFTETRDRMDSLQQGPAETRWYEVITTEREGD